MTTQEYSIALEQQLAAMRWSYACIRQAGSLRDGLAFRAMGEALARSAPFYVSPPIGSLIAAASHSLPAFRLRRDLLPTAGGFAYLAMPLQTTLLTDPPETMTLNAMSWLVEASDVPGTDCLHCWFWKPTGGRMRPVVFELGIWDWDETIEDAADRGGGSTARFAAYELLATFLLFIHQRIAVPHEESPDRSTRRRIARDQPSWDAPDVIRVVQLRAPESPPPEAQTPGIADWSCRWFVRGHWRNQWHGQAKGHRPVWIVPHLKGPTDKPIKPPAQPLFAVVR